MFLMDYTVMIHMYPLNEVTLIAKVGSPRHNLWLGLEKFSQFIQEVVQVI